MLYIIILLLLLSLKLFWASLWAIPFIFMNITFLFYKASFALFAIYLKLIYRKILYLINLLKLIMTFFATKLISFIFYLFFYRLNAWIAKYNLLLRLFYLYLLIFLNKIEIINPITWRKKCEWSITNFVIINNLFRH